VPSDVDGWDEATNIGAEEDTPQNEDNYVTRSGRQACRPTYQGDYVSYLANVYEKRNHIYTEDMDPRIALMLTGNQKNFYYHDILREPDCKELLQAMQRDIYVHNNNKNWVLVLHSTLPKSTKVIPSVWAVRRKRRLRMDGAIYIQEEI
jgi:hypothetical protein